MKNTEDTYLYFRHFNRRKAGRIYTGGVCSEVSGQTRWRRGTLREFVDIIHFAGDDPCTLEKAQQKGLKTEDWSPTRI